MKKQKAHAEHWMLTSDDEQIKKTKQKIRDLSLWGLGGLIFSGISFSTLAIPNLTPIVSMLSIFAGVTGFAVLTNSIRKAVILKKELKIDKSMRKCILAPSVEKLSKKERELYDCLYPKSQMVHIEHREERKKVNYSDYSNSDITIIEA